MAGTSTMIGRRLAQYEITAHLGSGGMGEVYQATDTRLGRSVALKLLPEAFARDPERVSRLEREAKTLAAFNHPHIAQVYGFEESDGVRALVMELVEGPTLAELIAGAVKSAPGVMTGDDRPAGGLSVTESLRIATQIAEALEAAHDKGIVHRDLKPANVKIAPDGQVKVLDFGLAKLTSDGPPTESLANSPTLTAMATHAGVILGTAAYMAPEQATGRPVDRRADIFAFGCVLFEMLTGRPAFEGDTVQEILSRVLQREPDWTRIPPEVPVSVQRLLRLCLEKDPRKRRQAAGDVRIDLEQALAEPEPRSQIVPARPRARLATLAWAGVAGVLAVALAFLAFERRGDTPPELRLQITTPPTPSPLDFALSPDGRFIALIGAEPNSSAQQLYLRSLQTGEMRVLAGTRGAQRPFWSPDSRSLGFFANARLLRIDITSGEVETLTDIPLPEGATWNADGVILFAPHTVSPILKISAAGGEPVAVTTVDAPRQVGHLAPSFLPDGRQFLFYAQGEPDVAGIYLGSLDGGPGKRLTPADTAAVFLPPDRIVYVQQGALVARQLDASRGELVGDLVTLASPVSTDFYYHGAFSVSATGIVAYRVASVAAGRTAWFDRSGRMLDRLDVSMNGPELSPDDRRVAYDRTIQGNRDVWISDLVRGGQTRFTFDANIDGYPIWSPDGSRIVFESTRKGTFDLWIRPSSGAVTEELLLETPDTEYPLSWSHDGRFVLYQRTNLKEKWDLWALPMTGGDRTPIAVANTPFAERMGQFAPDGHWVAYETNQSGRPEIVAQAFPESNGSVQVSTAGGAAPRWSGDGREIYFVAPDGTLTAVSVKAVGRTLEAGTPVSLFPTRLGQPFKHAYAVSRDGRFLMTDLSVDTATAPPPVNVILNWKP